MALVTTSTSCLTAVCRHFGGQTFVPVVVDLRRPPFGGQVLGGCNP